MRRKIDLLKIEKIEIHTNHMCYGPQPEDGEEISQTLSISSDGSVTLKRRFYFRTAASGANQNNNERQRGKLEYSKLGKAETEEFFSLMKNFIQRHGAEPLICDAGGLEMTVLYEDGSEEHDRGYKRVLGGPGPVNMSDWLREHVKLSGVWGF